jgi:hypothetical protein
LTDSISTERLLFPEIFAKPVILERAQVWTLRERFLKLGARVMVSVRRMVVHLPQWFPFLATFRHRAIELGAWPG